MTRRCLLSALTPSNTATRRPSWFIVAPWSCVFWGRTRLQVVPLPPLRVAGAEARGWKCSAANSIKQGKNLSPRGRDPSPHGLLCLQKEPNTNAVWRMDSEPFICLPSQPFFDANTLPATGRKRWNLHMCIQEATWILIKVKQKKSGSWDKDFFFGLSTSSSTSPSKDDP